MHEVRTRRAARVRAARVCDEVGNESKFPNPPGWTMQLTGRPMFWRSSAVRFRGTDPRWEFRDGFVGSPTNREDFEWSCRAAASSGGEYVPLGVEANAHSASAVCAAGACSALQQGGARRSEATRAELGGRSSRATRRGAIEGWCSTQESHHEAPRVSRYATLCHG